MPIAQKRFGESRGRTSRVASAQHERIRTSFPRPEGRRPGAPAAILRHPRGEAENASAGQPVLHGPQAHLHPLQQSHGILNAGSPETRR